MHRQMRWLGVAAVAPMVVLAAACSGTHRATASRKPAEAAPPPITSATTIKATTPTDTTTVVRPGSVVSSLPALDAQVSGLPATLGPWALVGRTYVLGAFSDQGLATITRPGGGAEIIYAGTLTVTPALKAEGWDHVGDPDGWNGWVVTPLQGGPGSQAKMFQVTAPDGTVTQAVHALSRGEAANNSFAAVTPDGQWTVSAEWGVEHRLLVFPTPMINPSYTPGHPLPLATTIRLQQPVSDLQGCAFAGVTSLMCSDPARLLEIDLDRPVASGSFLSATVHVLGLLPEVGGCTGPYEPEGVDVDRALQQLRVEISQPGPCKLFTQVYEYRRAGTQTGNG